ncbi:MAG: hypothetical protein DI589_06635 [Shinella sp.]|nr:MAG: hypothetical protein DI589_06635 [Shinella sp.]
MAGNEENQGLREAHTAADFAGAGAREDGAARLDVDPARAAKVGTVKATAEAALAGLAERLAGGKEEAEQPSLLFDLDEPHALFSGPVRHVAETREAAKRARGRPQGSINRRSDDLRNYLLSMGYRDPALNLADLANADPLALAVEAAALPGQGQFTPEQLLDAAVRTGVLERDALAEIVRKARDLVKSANAELMPYFHAKRPQEVHHEVRTLGVMIVGDMPTQKPGDDDVIDLTRVPSPE